MNSAQEWLMLPTPNDAPARHYGKIEIEEILRTMIVADVRQGRLTPKRRKRIVQFASHLGLSPLQAGKLVKACCDEASENAFSPCELRIVPCAEFGPDTVSQEIKNVRLRRQTAYFAMAAGCVMLILFIFVLLSGT